MLTLRQIVPQIRSKDWFVTIDLKEAYLHISNLPCHRRFPRFAFGGKAYQYWVLPFCLALSPRTLCVDAAPVPLQLQGIHIMNYIDDWLILAPSHQLAVLASRCRAGPHERVGVTAKRQKECAFSTTEDHLPWHGMGLALMQAHLSPARIESILSAVKSIGLGQSITVKPFQRLLGLMAAASNVIPFGLL